MIKFKTLKRIKKNYDAVFTNFKKSEELHVVVGNNGVDKVEIQISNHQNGMPLNKPHVEISAWNKSYSMSWETFIDKITS